MDELSKRIESFVQVWRDETLSDGVLWAGFALTIHPGHVASTLDSLSDDAKAIILGVWKRNPESLLADPDKLGLAPEIAEWCMANDDFVISKFSEN